MVASKKSDFKTALGYDQKIISGYQYQIEIQAKVLQSIQQALPKELATHVLYCTISGRKISLYTDSAAWSSQLRFYQQAIIKAAIDSEQGSFDTFQAKVIPKVKESKVKKKTIIPSEENIGLLLDQAEHQSDDKLKNSLLRLGNTLKKCRHNKNTLKNK
jgi:hypothetical protein